LAVVSIRDAGLLLAAALVVALLGALFTVHPV
jgi:hypothetical protein